MQTNRSVFDFGENGVCKPDTDGRYRGSFFYCHPDNDGISEPEAIRQWLCSVIELNPSSPNWQYIERLAELAEGCGNGVL